jgi:hypothetical protein
VNGGGQILIVDVTDKGEKKESSAIIVQYFYKTEKIITSRHKNLSFFST